MNTCSECDAEISVNQDVCEDCMIDIELDYDSYIDRLCEVEDKSDIICQSCFDPDCNRPFPHN